MMFAPAVPLWLRLGRTLGLMFLYPRLPMRLLPRQAGLFPGFALA